MPGSVTVASYNMHKGVGLDRRRDPHRVLEVLHEIDADIVALQEADKRFGGRGSAVPHELIDSHSHYKPVHFGVRHKRVFDKARKHTDRLFKIDTRNIGWHGNAILVKPHIGVLDCAALDLPTLEPRGAVIAELLIDEKPLRVIGMHLDLSGLWRKRQVRAILDAIAARPQKMPTVLMGDTNEWRTIAGCLQELEPEFHLAPTGPSFHARHPVAALDRIIVHKDLNIEAAGVHHSAAARRASDHLPIWARLTMRPAASTYRLFAWAIENRMPIACDYQGFPRGICPIVLGRNSQGAEVALVWQVSGRTSRGPLLNPEWKCLQLSKVRDAEPGEGPWLAGSSHQQKQSCVADVDYDANQASPYNPTRSLGDLRGAPLFR